MALGIVFSPQPFEISVPASTYSEKVQFSSVPWPIASSGDMRDVSEEILFQSFLQEALRSSSGMGRDVHSFMLSIDRFLCRLRRRPHSKVPWRMVLERLSWRVTCLNHASFRLSTVARRGSCDWIRLTKVANQRLHVSIYSVLDNSSWKLWC